VLIRPLWWRRVRTKPYRKGSPAFCANGLGRTIWSPCATMPIRFCPSPSRLTRLTCACWTGRLASPEPTEPSSELGSFRDLERRPVISQSRLSQLLSARLANGSPEPPRLVRRGTVRSQLVIGESAWQRFASEALPGDRDQTVVDAKTGVLAIAGNASTLLWFVFPREPRTTRLIDVRERETFRLRISLLSPRPQGDPMTKTRLLRAPGAAGGQHLSVVRV
jgi:hypothetical protein